jgi:hypothetical protein
MYILGTGTNLFGKTEILTSQEVPVLSKFIVSTALLTNIHHSYTVVSPLEIPWEISAQIGW